MNFLKTIVCAALAFALVPFVLVGLAVRKIREHGPWVLRDLYRRLLNWWWGGERQREEARRFSVSLSRALRDENAKRRENDK